MSTKKKTQEAPKVDAALTLWEAIEDTSKEGLAAIGEQAGQADAALESAPETLAVRCREIAAAVLYGPRGTQADIARGIQAAKGGTLAAAKKTAQRFASVGRILIAQPDMDVLKVRTFVRDAKEEDIAKAIEKGTLTPTGPKKKTNRGPGKKTRTLREQVEAASKENAKVLTMAKVPDAIPTEDLELFAKSLRASLQAAEKMLTVAAGAEKVAAK